jgi:hypothetical protein
VRSRILHAPFAFQIALLHRRDRPVDQHQPDVLRLKRLAQPGQLPGTEQRARARPRHRLHLGPDQRDTGQRGGQRARLFERRGGVARRAAIGDVGMDEPGAQDQPASVPS